MPTPPNILLILTDQHHADYLGCLGHPFLRTPHLDALAEVSHVFRSAYTPSPICGPARASLFTGLYPLQHRATHNWQLVDPAAELLTTRLADLGYFNALVGKLHLSPAADMHGFHWRRLCDSPHALYDPEEVVHNDYLPWAANGMGISVEELTERATVSERVSSRESAFWEGAPWTDDAHQMTTWTGNEAVGFLEEVGQDRPFFLNVSFFGPHHPYSSCEPWDSLYDPAAIELPATFGQEAPVDQGTKGYDWSPELWQRMIACYCGQISAIDLQVGRILQALRERGLWDDTLIVFSADHGDHMGDYCLLGKGTMLESSVRIPMIVKPPGPPQSRREHDEVVSLLDLYPTFLAAAGEEPGPRALQHLLEKGGQWVNETYSYIGGPEAKQAKAMVIRDNHKLVASIRNFELTTALGDRDTPSVDASYSTEASGTHVALRQQLSDWLQGQLAASGR